jgi:hypothetical protein
MEQKKPDNVADNPGLLPYGSNLGAPAIRQEDITDWKVRGANRVNSEFKARYEELKDEYRKLIEEFKWNDLIYHAEYSFEPINGHEYHLYKRENGTIFLSIISQYEWNRKGNLPYGISYIASFQLDSKDKWNKI